MGENKSQKGLIIAAIIAMIVLDIAVVGFVLWYFLGRTDDNKKVYEKKVTTESVSTQEKAESILDGMEETVDEGDDSRTDFNNAEIRIVVDGVKVTIPKDFFSTVLPDVGPVVSLDEVFQMKLAVKEINYSDAMKHPDERMQGACEAGGKITKELEETEINGKKYGYFCYTLDGDSCMVIYTEAPVQNKCFCSQAVLENEMVKAEDILNSFALVAENAVETDEANTTYDDIMEQQRIANLGEKRNESTIKLGGMEITHKVADGFYYDTDLETDEVSEDEEWGITFEDYRSEDKVQVECELHGTMSDAKQEIEDINEYSNGSNGVKTTEINGYTVYYVMERYEHDAMDVQKVTGACTLKNGGMFKVNLWVHDTDVNYTFDSIAKFFEITEE